MVLLLGLTCLFSRTLSEKQPGRLSARSSQGLQEVQRKRPSTLATPIPMAVKSSSGFSAPRCLQGSSVADSFSESVFSCKENRTEELCAEKSIKCELGPGMSFQIISKKTSSSDLYFKRTPKMPLFLSLCSFKFH